MATGKGFPRKPIDILSGLVNNSTAIKRGHLIVQLDDTDLNLVGRCAASNSAKVLGVANSDGAGGPSATSQNTEIGIDRGGNVEVLNTSGAAIAAGDPLVSHSGGGVMTAASTNKNILGRAYVRIEDGEIGSASFYPNPTGP